MQRRYEKITFNSGLEISAQAGEGLYSHPRNDCGPYSAIELGYPSAVDSIIADYAESPDYPLETVYPWVPAGVFIALLIKNGGVMHGTYPELILDDVQSLQLAEVLQKIEDQK